MIRQRIRDGNRALLCIVSDELDGVGCVLHLRGQHIKPTVLVALRTGILKRRKSTDRILAFPIRELRDLREGKRRALICRRGIERVGKCCEHGTVEVGKPNASFTEHRHPRLCIRIRLERCLCIDWTDPAERTSVLWLTNLIRIGCGYNVFQIQFPKTIRLFLQDIQLKLSGPSTRNHLFIRIADLLVQGKKANGLGALDCLVVLQGLHNHKL